MAKKVKPAAKDVPASSTASTGMKKLRQGKKAKKCGTSGLEKVTKKDPKISDYRPGELSGLFGKKPDKDLLRTEVKIGGNISTSTAREKVQIKSTALENSNVEEEKGLAEGRDASAPFSNRVQQRENRQKAKEALRAKDAEQKRTIFVGNMPLTATERTVKSLFSTYGKVESVRMRNLVPSKENISKRVAHLAGKINQKSFTFYVKFAEEDGATKSLEFNGKSVEGNVVRVEKCAGSDKFSKSAAVFVGNIPFKTTEDELTKAFTEQVGDVNGVRLMRDSATGIGKGYAFVNFDSEASATLAVSLGTMKVGKRDLRISNLMKKNQIAKHSLREKNKKKWQPPSEVGGKMEQFKFSNRKSRSEEQVQRRLLKKSAKKAINKKNAAKKKNIMQ